MPRTSQLRKRSDGHYYCHINGKQRRLGKSKAEATRRFGRLLAGLDDEPSPLAGKPRAVKTAFEAYMIGHHSVDRFSRLKPFVKWLDDDGITEISQFDNITLADYHNWLLENYTGWTPWHRAKAAQHWCSWLHGLKWIENMPLVPKVRRPPRISRDKDPAKVKKALAGCPRALRDILIFIAETGCRPIEARKLVWGDVIIRSRMIRLQSHKTVRTSLRERLIALSDKAVALLKSVREPGALDGDLVFPTSTGQQWSANYMARLCREHNGFSPYSLRHTNLQARLEQGHDIAVVAAIAGHSGLQTILDYTEIREGMLRKAAENMEDVL